MSTPNGEAANRELIRAAQARAMQLMQPPPVRVSPADRDDSAAAGLPTDSFAGYQVVREIHRGGQGIVYQAIQQGTNRKVAIKLMRERVWSDSRELSRFEREVQILAQLNHPRIVRISECGRADGLPYFVMDYVAGHPLDVYMADARRTIRQKIELFACICEAVNAAHLLGVIHRDLKPSNIRIDANGEPCILDFGLAKVTGWSSERADPHAHTMTGQFVGSLPWASPEQAEGAPAKIDIRTDVYSLGVIVYQMLTGRFPYGIVGNMPDVLDNIMTAEPVRPRAVRRDIDDEVETIVLKSLAKERERRYQSAGELARDLRRYLAGEPIEAKRDSTWYVLRKSLGKHRLKFAMASLIALVFLAAGATALLAQRRVVAAQRTAQAARMASDAAQREAKAAQLRSILAHVRSGQAPQPAEDLPRLYQDFYTRLRTGEATEEQKDAFLSNALVLRIQTRSVIPADQRWQASASLSWREDLPRPEVSFHVAAAWYLAGKLVATCGGESRDPRSGLPDMLDLFGLAVGVDGATGLDETLPLMTELKVVADVDFVWSPPELPEPYIGIPVQRSVRLPSLAGLPVIARAQYVARQPVRVLSTLPDDYPVPVRDAETVRAVDAGLQIGPLEVHSRPARHSIKGAAHNPLELTLSYSLASMPLAVRVELSDAQGGAMLAKTSTLNLLPGTPMTISPQPLKDSESWPALASGQIRSVRVRLVPDREVALSSLDVEFYYGAVTERIIPVTICND